MNRTQTATYSLMASAFILTALIFLQASRWIESRAYAEMVVNKDSITMISTRYQADTEIVYVLDSQRGRLMAYLLNPNRQTIELLQNGVMDLPREFGSVFRGAAGGGGGGGVNEPPKKRTR